MEKPQIFTGLGATVQIDVDTPLFRYLFHDLRMRSIEPIDPSDAHLTLVDSSVTSFRVNTVKDLDAIEEAKKKGSEFLGEIAFKGWELYPEKPEVTKLNRSKRGVGIYFDDEEGELKELRGELLDVFAEASHGKVCLRKQSPFKPHLKLGTRTGDYYKEGRAFSPKQRKKILIPESCLMTEVYEVSDKTIEVERGEVAVPLFDANPYINKPPTVRRAI